VIHTLVDKLTNRFRSNKKETIVLQKKKRKKSQWPIFTTDEDGSFNRARRIDRAIAKSIQKDPPIAVNQSGMAMDASPQGKFGFQPQKIVPDAQFLWYASQGFIGYQMAAILAQHWLISKACLMPAKDAIRNGYKVTVNDGTEVEEDVIDAIHKADVKYNINQQMVQFIQMGRVFGIRVAVFIIETNDVESFYLNPFNIDGVTEGSYKGITQIDPYWMTPELDGQAAGDPAAPDFYEPTWWRVNGLRIHRSHLIVFRTEEVADILKPNYIYGGIPIPQKIYERVYAAERTANEAPMLAMTKRLDVLKIDLPKAAANPTGLIERLRFFASNRDNYGTKAIGIEEELNQFDTSLSDLDTVIMSQLQLVAAASNVPATKLLGTSPKGFNATGEYEEANYHEELESIQAHDLTPFLERHHMLLIKSEIAPQFNMSPFATTVEWESLDAMTAKEEADLNKVKADTASVLSSLGAIDGNDERQRIISDPKSGYTGLTGDAPEQEEESDPDYGDDPIE